MIVDKHHKSKNVKKINNISNISQRRKMEPSNVPLKFNKYMSEKSISMESKKPQSKKARKALPDGN